MQKIQEQQALKVRLKYQNIDLNKKSNQRKDQAGKDKTLKADSKKTDSDTK